MREGDTIQQPRPPPQKCNNHGKETKIWWNAIQYYVELCTKKTRPQVPAWDKIKEVCDTWLATLNPETSELWNLLLALGTVYLQCTSTPKERRDYWHDIHSTYVEQRLAKEQRDYWHDIHSTYVEQRHALSGQKPPKVLNVNPEWAYMFRTFM